MDRRLQKRHKRQVARAKERVKLSEPDVRTPEQVKAAQEASRPAGRRNNVRAPYATRPGQVHTGSVADTTPKVDD
jgi:hypothetical protein